MKRECETCIKKKTLYCPISMECMATDDMPYYQNRIMLLEENEKLKNQQKGFVKYLENEKDRLIKECSHYYIDSFDRQHSVNEDIFNEVNKILAKYNEFILEKVSKK